MLCGSWWITGAPEAKLDSNKDVAPAMDLNTYLHVGNARHPIKQTLQLHSCSDMVLHPVRKKLIW